MDGSLFRSCRRKLRDPQLWRRWRVWHQLSRVRRRFRLCRLRQCPDRFANLSANKSLPHSNRPAGTAARPPKSSASLPPHSIAVSATTTSNEEDSHKKTRKSEKTNFLFCDLCAFLWLNHFLSNLRSILPRSFFGSESTNSIQRGYL